MQTKPSIKFHFGASNDDIAVDGQTFTRHKLDKGEFTTLRRILIGALEKIGYFRKEGRK